MNTSSGFTTIELLSLILFIGIVGGIGLNRYEALQAVHRDHDRKVAINTIYHNLEEIAKPALGGYPKTLQASQLKAMDSGLLKDPHGVLIGTSGSDYRYEPTGCNGGTICKDFTLSSRLENEGDYVKSSIKN